MCQPLWPAGLAEIRQRVREAGALSLFLDFDGTLAPIVNDPGEACLGPGVRSRLAALAARNDTLVAIVSGRALADLRPRVGIARAVYAGNHGLEISGPEISGQATGGRPVCFVEPCALARREPLRRIVGNLTTRLAHIPGVLVENKVLTASVHYRQAAAGEARHITEIVRLELAHSLNNFQVNHGKMVLEIVPRTDWHKGAAVGWINTRLAMPGARSIYIGDDRTDEDAFARMTDEITIRVGRSVKTSARYFVKDPAQVHAFLEWLSENR